jgi:hypothetical protein
MQENNITNIILVDASESLNGSRVERYQRMVENRIRKR